MRGDRRLVFFGKSARGNLKFWASDGALGDPLGHITA